MIANTTELINKITNIVSNLLINKEIELIDIAYKRRGPDMVLSLILDKKGHAYGEAGGITIDECGQVSDELGGIIEKDDVITGRYLLEVASPGLDRPLKARKDFERVMGKQVRINTYGPVEDKREHIGKVALCDDEAVVIELADGPAKRRIPIEMISKAQLKIDPFGKLRVDPEQSRRIDFKEKR